MKEDMKYLCSECLKPKLRHEVKLTKLPTGASLFICQECDVSGTWHERESVVEKEWRSKDHSSVH